jgi:membrane protease YdiL (CAAX protease family)
MTTDPEAPATTHDTAWQRDLVTLLIAMGVAVVLTRIVGSVARTGGIPSPVLQVLADDLAVWVPLVVGALLVMRETRAEKTLSPLRFRLDLGDAVFAIGIVIVTRAFDAFLSIAFNGTTGLTPPPSLGTPDLGLLVAAALGIVVISPVLEEIVFRGLFQRRLAAELTPRTRFLAVVLTALLFAILHVLLGAGVTPLEGFRVFLTTFALGALTGTLVAMTDRIGGAILAHVLFNAVAVVATWPR